MSIEFLEDYPVLFKVERHSKIYGATEKTNIGYIAQRKDGSIHFCGYDIEELETILAKMKELQSEVKK